MRKSNLRGNMRRDLVFVAIYWKCNMRSVIILDKWLACCMEYNISSKVTHRHYQLPLISSMFTALKDTALLPRSSARKWFTYTERVPANEAVCYTIHPAAFMQQPRWWEVLLGMSRFVVATCGERKIWRLVFWFAAGAVRLLTDIILLPTRSSATPTAAVTAVVEDSKWQQQL